MRNMFRPKNQGVGTEYLSTPKASSFVGVRLFIIGLAIAVGSLVSATTATAAPMTCTQAMAVSTIYQDQGDVQFIFGSYVGANYYYGKAQAILEAVC